MNLSILRLALSIMFERVKKNSLILLEIIMHICLLIYIYNFLLSAAALIFEYYTFFGFLVNAFVLPCLFFFL
jgi:hypothetical protein